MIAWLVGWVLQALVPFQTGEERAALAVIAGELGQL
jgi:hypothetical protein